jgi:hypothetical protein
MNRAWWFSLLLVSGGTALAGCSGANETDATSEHAAGHAGSGAGGADSVAGGAGHPTSRPAQGNLTLNIQSLNRMSCPVAGKVYVLGDPQGPNTVTPGDRLVDGVNGASIECSVRGTGPYTFSGTISGISSEDATVEATITNGVVNADKLSGSATFSVHTPDLGSTFSSESGGCTVNVIAENVKSGSLWASISCPSVTSPSTGQVCAIGSISAFVLENCDGL